MGTLGLKPCSTLGVLFRTRIKTSKIRGIEFVLLVILDLLFPYKAQPALTGPGLAHWLLCPFLLLLSTVRSVIRSAAQNVGATGAASLLEPQGSCAP